jgi:hypothetical protein
MQSPGRANEDTRGGFTHGGWAEQYMDDEALAATYGRVSEGGGLQLLLGRRSYEEMLGYWNTQDSPFKGGSTTPPSIWPRRRSASRCPGRTRPSSAVMSARRSRS